MNYFSCRLSSKLHVIKLKERFTEIKPDVMNYEYTCITEMYLTLSRKLS